MGFIINCIQVGWLDFSSLKVIGKTIRLLKYLAIIISIFSFIHDIQSIASGLKNLFSSQFNDLVPFLTKYWLLCATSSVSIILYFADKLITSNPKLEEVSLAETEAGRKLWSEIKTAYDGKGSLKDFAIGAGVSDPKINAMLLQASISKTKLHTTIANKPYYAYSGDSHEKDRLKIYAIRRNIRKKAKITNEQKIRMKDDLTLDPDTKVELQKTDYISSLMTDQLGWLIVRKCKSPKKILHDGYSSFLTDDKDNRQLMSLRRCKSVSNQIGASTLAFSNDGYLMLVWQSKKNAQSPGYLAPSGSGSLDWSDIGNNNDLLSIVKTGASRELVEECGLATKKKKNDISIDCDTVKSNHIEVYAFSRMLHRSGKPEFFCLAGLPFSCREINEATLTKKEKRYTIKTEEADINPINFNAKDAEIKQQLLEVCALYSDKASVERMFGEQYLGTSYPLQHGLVLLAAVLESELCEEMIKFLKTSLRSSSNQAS